MIWNLEKERRGVLIPASLLSVLDCMDGLVISTLIHGDLKLPLHEVVYQAVIQ